MGTVQNPLKYTSLCLPQEGVSFSKKWFFSAKTRKFNIFREIPSELYRWKKKEQLFWISVLADRLKSCSEVFIKNFVVYAWVKFKKLYIQKVCNQFNTTKLMISYWTCFYTTWNCKPHHLICISIMDIR